MTKRSINSVLSGDSTTTSSSSDRRRNPTRACRSRDAPPAKQKCIPARKAKEDWSSFQFESDFTKCTRPSQLIPVIGNCSTGRDVVEVMTKFRRSIAFSCTEAQRAQFNGSVEVNPFKIAGIPTRKFLKSAAWDSSCQYQVQALYPVTGKKNSFYVSYEGWEAESIGIESGHSLKSWGMEGQICKIRSTFLMALDRIMDFKKSDIIRKQMYLCQYLLEDSKNIFWLYEDLTHFHSQLHKDQGLAPVYYMCLEMNQVNLPTCTLVTSNLLIGNTIDHIIRQKYNKSFQELRNKHSKMPLTAEKYEYCKNCKCNDRFEILYKAEDVINLQPDRNGRVDLSNVDPANRWIIIECSDVCGCPASCPRRPSQRGQQKALVINYEGPASGFGVRAGENIKKGEFVCEYTGEMFHLKKSKLEQDYQRLIADTSYDMGFEVIDSNLIISAKHAGNVARFFNHHCKPNADFIEIHTRKYESDPMIPKVAIFAKEDIATGEEITIAYWPIKEYPPTSEIRCLCNAPKCIKWLPGRIVDDE